MLFLLDALGLLPIMIPKHTSKREREREREREVYIYMYTYLCMHICISQLHFVLIARAIHRSTGSKQALRKPKRPSEGRAIRGTGPGSVFHRDR